MLTAEGVLDAERVFMEAAEAERPEVHVPLAIIDLDEPDVFARRGSGSHLPNSLYQRMPPLWLTRRTS